MLRALLIAPDATLRDAVHARIRESGGLLVLREFDRYPDLDELAGSIRVHDPQVICVDVATDASAVGVSGLIQERHAGVAVLALHRAADPDSLVQLLRAGVREFLAYPFAEEDFLESMSRVRAAVPEDAGPSETTDAVYAFLPAKPGAGASTLAINTALALSRLDGHRALLVDFDFAHGVSRFQLSVESPFSVHDVAARLTQLDPALWSDLVGSNGRLDVLASAPLDPRQVPHVSLVATMFDFMRRQYQSLTLDCPGSLDAYALEVLAQCRRIFLVTQPDITTVHLGREKLRLLESMELADRVELVVNRWRKDAPIGLADIEEVLGIPAEHLIPDDPKAAYQGVLSGSGADAASQLGKHCSAFARSLAERTQSIPLPAPRKRMIEYFSILPARDTFLPSGR